MNTQGRFNYECIIFCVVWASGSSVRHHWMAGRLVGLYAHWMEPLSGGGGFWSARAVKPELEE
jgi:hypothetical protein